MIEKGNIKTKIFLDSGDPKETKEILDALGFLDGQTTNPSLVAKNPQISEKFEKEGFSEAALLNNYKEIVQEISSLIPEGSVSVEVHAEAETLAEKMIEQGREMNSWIPNAHIKLPITKEGLKAANTLVKEGIRVNMTLCFSEEQAGAVHDATLGAGKGQVYISPFIGRLEDIGQNGIELVSNILRMYREAGSHVEVLSASIRNMEQLMESMRIGSDIATLPASVLKEWAENSLVIPDEKFKYDVSKFQPIPFNEVDMSKNWEEYNIQHDLTDKGLAQFAEDWNKLMG